MDYLTITDADIDQLESFFDGEWHFDESRRKALKNHDDVQACPGSGKTTLVSAKLLLLSQKWREQYKGICVLTHTNVAKAEILKRLKKHPAGHLLSSYPHFIGTIQEFVNKFLGLPFLRRKYKFRKFAENKEFQLEFTKIKKDRENPFDMQELCRLLYRKCGKAKYHEIEVFLETLYFINKDMDIVFHGQFNQAICFKNSTRPTYTMLRELKERINKAGIFHYRDMYTFGEKLLIDSPNIKNILQKRFPYVFIDEMQDTQDFQDELLNRIFISDNVILQRFGDPDQAIFNNMRDGKPNTSYNQQKSLVSIQDSHRFGHDIAGKIKGFSYRKLSNLGSARVNYPIANTTHTIFLYDDQTIQDVLPKFGDLVYDTLPEATKCCIKAVGGVGKEKENGLTIKNYWSGYDKTMSQKSFKPNRLIQTVKKCGEQREGSVAENYNLLLQGILDLLHKAGKKSPEDDNYYNTTKLRQKLENDGVYEGFRLLLVNWMLLELPNEMVWEQNVKQLKNLLDIQSTKEINDFLAYDHTLVSEKSGSNMVPSNNNVYECLNGVKIEVSTIHGVKGETHDATLVLETKYNRYFDITELLDYLIDEDKKVPFEDLAHPRKKETIRASFMKKLYVASSRPRHLLCLAMRKEGINKQKQNTLIAKGWSFCDLTK